MRKPGFEPWCSNTWAPAQLITNYYSWVRVRTWLVVSQSTFQVKNILLCGHRCLKMFACWWQAVSSERDRMAHCKAVLTIWKTAPLLSEGQQCHLTQRAWVVLPLISAQTLPLQGVGAARSVGKAGTGASASGELLPIAWSCWRETGWSWALGSEALREEDTGIRF